METCVLIPQELILGASSHNETVLAVRTSQRLERAMRLLPFQGTVRTDKIEVSDKIDDEDVSARVFELKIVNRFVDNVSRLS